MKYTKKQITKLLDGIYNGVITDMKLPEDLYFAIADYLKKGLYDGFGSTLAEATGKDLRILTELRENVYIFSGAKTYNEVSAFQSMLTKDGELVSKSEFFEIAQREYNLFNVDWAATEYNTAIQQAQNVVAWNRIQDEKDILPMLRYSTVETACDICGPLNDLVAPVDDPVWATVAPENHYNCRCLLLQEPSDVKTTENYQEIVSEVEGKMQDTFKNNAGQTNEIFSSKHPYFENAPKEQGKENFGLPIPEKD